ncbi:PAS domain-containing protein [Asticcacaulis sp. AND118]|uniref:PAS domain-containing protein n=1 Tax=Asticcacaulis sp. AND118 TaxID=2840468 RepID=UPI001CFFEB46|nr:PAS domain-containing protein [Asticcacaulis sp. AND118]UDF04771.1 PAS domain-containing protein [Asticcacaulis sp. AND118]
MLLESEADLIVVLGVLAALLLGVAIVAGIIAVIKTSQVRQFQDLLFKAERKIDQLERRMFNVLNAVPVALVETDATGKFIFANKTAHQLLGRKDNELIGLRFHSATWGITYPDGRVIPPDLLPIARTLRGQTVKGFQHLIVNHGSRTKVLVSVTSMPIMNTNGEVIGSTTALVEIETQTGEGVGDISGVWRGHWFSAAPVPFWGLDQNGTVLDLNPRVGSLLDTPRDQAMNANWAQVFVADADFQKAVDFLADLPPEGQANGRPSSINLSLKDVRGQTHPVILTAWIVHTQDGEAQGITVAAIPTKLTLSVSETPALAAPVVTAAPALSEDAQQALEDLQKAELARAALGVGVWSYDPVSDSIVEDEGMRRLIGREFDGGPTRITAEDQLRANDAFGRLMSGQSDRLDLDLTIPQADGSVRHVSLKGQGKIVDGQRELFGVAIDVTDAKAVPEIVPDAAPVIIEDTAKIEALQADIEDLRHARAETEAERDALRGELEALKVEAAKTAENPELEVLRAELEALKTAEPVAVEVAPDTSELEAALAEIETLKARTSELTALETELETLRQDYATLAETVAPPVVENDPRDAEIEALKAEVAELQGLKALESELAVLKTEKAELEAEFTALQAVPAPQAKPERQISDIAADISPLNRVWKTDGTLTRLSSGWQVLTGCGAQEFFGEGWLDSLHPDDQDRIHAELTMHLAQKTGGDLSYRVKTPAGFKPVLERLSPVTTDEAFDGLVGVAFDLSAHLPSAPPPVTEAGPDRLEYLTLKARTGQLELEIAQLQLAKLELERQAERLDTALILSQRYETVGRLAGDVAADFSQMLNVMNAALDMIGRQADNQDLRRLSEAALAAGKRGERLTRQLLAFTVEAKEKA